MESDEAVARARLLSMQERIVRDPFDALGLGTAATPDVVRSAFLELTKVYHPARFGRMSSEIQRLANEVFLALRSAHDTVARSVRARATTAPTGATAPSTTSSQSQAIQSLAAGTARTPFGQGVKPATAPGVTAKRPSDQLPPARPSVGPPERPTPIPPAARPRTAEMPVLHKPSTSRLPMQRTGAMPPVAKATPAEGTRAIPPAPLPAGPERDVATALELLGRGQWDAGRAILQSLADRFPATPRYRALVCYALGRQAQVEQRLNEARIELDRALQIDPTLQLAKTALGELFSRRK